MQHKYHAHLTLILILAFILPLAPAQSLDIQPLYSFSTVTDSGYMLGTIAVGNVDDDADLEIIVNSREGISVYDYDGTLVSSFNTVADGETRDVNIAPTLADIDGDGRDEIIFATNRMTIGDPSISNSVFAINGEDGSVVWEMPITHATYSTPDSGHHTLEGKFYYDGAEHDQLPAQTTFTAIASAIPVFDIDNDGQPEAVVNLKIRPEPVQDYNPYINDIWGFGEYGTVGESWSGGNFILDAVSGSRDYIYHILQLSEAGVALGSVDDTQGTAVFVLADNDSVVAYHKTAPHGFYGAGNTIGQFGKNSRIQSGSYKKAVTLNAVDLTGDGKVEVLYEGRNVADLLWQGNSTIFDHHGRILWREWYDFPETTTYTNHWPNASQMIPVNLDGDNPEVLSWHHTNELFYEEWDGVELVSKGGQWPVNFGTEYPSPPVIGDVDGDGEEEFIVARYDPSNLDAGGGLTILGQDGSVEDSINTTVGIKNIPNLYDVNQDGDLDIIVRDIGGTVHIYDTESGDPSRVSWATEYRNMARTGALGMRLYDAQAPIVEETVTGYQRAELHWEAATTTDLSGFEIYRKLYTDSDFTRIAALQANARSFEDTGLDNGILYIYKIAAVYDGTSVTSAPIPATPLTENNLVHNPAMERNGDHSWDKWYTGDLNWSVMTKTSAQAYQGNASMQIHLDNDGDNSSIKQWNQYGVIDAQLQVVPGRLYSFGAFIKTNLNQASRHFIEWGTDYDLYRHDPVGDPLGAREYPFYFSTRVINPAGESDWWYSNRTFTMHDGITGVAPRHRFYIDSSNLATGDIYVDNIFFREVNTESADALTLLPLESNWHYTYNTPPTDWYTHDFDDSAWAVGQAKFGNGSGPDNVNTEVPQYQDNYYFRTTFNLQDSLSEWVAGGYATTGPDIGPNSKPGIKDIYINGQYIPIHDPGLSDDPGDNVRWLDLTPFIPLLVQGENAIAIRLVNKYNTSWDDVAFDMQLKGIVQSIPMLEASKSASPSLPRTGDDVRYTIALNNPGPVLSGVRVTDTLPAQLAYQGDLWASSGTTTYAGNTLTWHGDLPPHSSVTITFTARPVLSETIALPIVNTALVDDGTGNIKTCQVTIIVNANIIYLPIVMR